MFLWEQKLEWKVGMEGLRTRFLKMLYWRNNHDQKTKKKNPAYLGRDPCALAEENRRSAHAQDCVSAQAREGYFAQRTQRTSRCFLHRPSRPSWPTPRSRPLTKVFESLLILVAIAIKINFAFEHYRKDLTQPGTLSFLPDGSFDGVRMRLFLSSPQLENMVTNRGLDKKKAILKLQKELYGQIRRLLKVGGKIIYRDSVFYWLQPPKPPEWAVLGVRLARRCYWAGAGAGGGQGHFASASLQPEHLGMQRSLPQAWLASCSSASVPHISHLYPPTGPSHFLHLLSFSMHPV